MRWVELACMGEMRNAYKILVRIPEGNSEDLFKQELNLLNLSPTHKIQININYM
jgi:hypothetical protein